MAEPEILKTLRILITICKQNRNSKLALQIQTEDDVKIILLKPDEISFDRSGFQTKKGYIRIHDIKKAAVVI